LQTRHFFSEQPAQQKSPTVVRRDFIQSDQNNFPEACAPFSERREFTILLKDLGKLENLLLIMDLLPYIRHCEGVLPEAIPSRGAETASSGSAPSSQ
jgi:hypothetical protein